MADQLTPLQLRILNFLLGMQDWATRSEIAAVTRDKKGFSKALGAPTNRKTELGTLEELGFVERRDRTPPFHYKITPSGTTALADSVKDDELSVYFFNNCNGRDHVAHFGNGAFFDLGTTGIQRTQARNLRLGQKCVVATTAPGKRIIEFNWYSFQREKPRVDETGAPARVFFGKFVTSETLDKLAAARDGRYSIFFDRNGNFKQRSVFHADVPPEARPTLTTVGFDTDEPYAGGQELWRLHLQKERNPKAVHDKKKKVLAATGKLLCEVCDFDFALTYGVLGYGFAECHHRIPLAELKGEHRILLKELAIVCANCHRMLHRQPPHTIEEMRKVVLGRQGTM